MTEKVSSFAPNNIMTHWSYFDPMAATNIVEDVDNAKKFNV
jgi:hypothetical protein